MSARVLTLSRHSGSPVHDPTGVWNPFTLYYVEVRALNDEIFKDHFGN